MSAISVRRREAELCQNEFCVSLSHKMKRKINGAISTSRAAQSIDVGESIRAVFVFLRRDERDANGLI
jgi:hypothetical protein